MEKPISTQKGNQLVPGPDTVQLALTEGSKNKFGKIGVELYSPPRVLPVAMPDADSYFSFDILTGWNFDCHVLKKLSQQLLMQLCFFFLYLSPPCTMFSELQRLFNYKRMNREVWAKRMQQAIAWIDHSMLCAQIQVKKNLFFMYEHPHKASSWDLPSVKQTAALSDVQLVTFDMCACGMRSPAGLPVKKRTTIMTNSSRLASALRTRQCSRDHEHRPIEGSERGFSMSKWCQKYPPGLVELLADAMVNG